MYSSFQLARKYLRYYATALNGNGHGMHSPFVFNFILDVLNNRQRYGVPTEVEQLRRQLAADKRVLQIEDLGAGSRSGAGKTRSVRQLARSAVKPKKYSSLMYRLVRHYQPAHIIELGTSLGLTTAHMALANPLARVHTIEGSAAIHQVAVENFKHLQLSNIDARLGNFDAQLPLLLRELPAVDLAYVDGNHRYEPTMRYFEQLLPHMQTTGIMVFDDIHWSKEMEQAWTEIRQHPSVKCTVDIFFLGFVFLQNSFRHKQDFAVRF